MNWTSRNEMSRPDDLRRSNLRSVLATLRAHDNVSRTDIARERGLSPATVSTLIGGLMDQGIVVPHEADGDDKTARRGRPQVVLSLSPHIGFVATMTIILNSATVSLWDYAGHLIHAQDFAVPTQRGSPRSIIDSLCNAIDSVLAAKGLSRRQLVQISVGVQGVTDVERRSMIWTPITAKPIRMAEELEARFGVPTTVANDCEMMAAAITAERIAELGSDFIVVTLSRGIGMSIVRQGSVVSGVSSSAMEFGHMVFRHGGARCRCGQTGCIEAYAGDYAIWRAVRGWSEDVIPDDDISREEYAEIFARAQAGPGVERDAFRTAGMALGVGLRSVFALLDRLPVIFVGFGAVAQPILEQEIRAVNMGNTLPSANNDLILKWRSAARPLVSRGCALTALESIDDRIADGRI